MVSVPHPPLIALLTDFGLRDWYVGTMKGVILSICPEAVLVDINHGVARQSIEEGAFNLKVSHAYFPDGTIFLCVIDPEVGSTRQPIVARSGRHYFVAPDNGLLTLLAVESQEWETRVLENPAYRLSASSNTFHGRDIFAPAAAHLARGATFEDFGRPLSALAEPHFMANVQLGFRSLSGRVIYIDYFGNLLTNVTRGMMPDDFDAEKNRLTIKGNTIYRVGSHYSAVPPRRPLVYWGSSGVLEIGINGESAAKKWSVKNGEWFEMEWS